MTNETVTDWATTTLIAAGYKINTPTPDVILHTAWSQVFRFDTNCGFVFLKQVPASLLIEVKILDILHNQFNASVPKIIAHNDEFHCFLMQDAGIALYDYFKKDFQAEILIQFMQTYSQLQIMSAHQLQLFFDVGVPDWRLNKLPMLYQNLLEKENMLTDDGITRDELKQLQNLKSKLVEICDQLSCYNIIDTFGHADLHDKNILINTATYETTLIDLGEVVITHPFFSLQNCLHRTTEHFALSMTAYQLLQKTCFEPWLALETEQHLNEILSLIQQIWSIHAVLGEYRLMQSVDAESRKILCKQGRFARKLRFWINQT